MPTPNVPSKERIEAARQKWENSHSSSYFIETLERTQETNRMVRVVVVDDEVQAAQTLQMENGGEWSEPEAMPLQDAQMYTVEGLFNRLLADASGGGPSPVNLDVTFNPSLGYPAVVHADALPIMNEEGELVLNRQHSYDLSADVKILLMETFSSDREPVLTLIRSGGTEAWCDILRVFPDGSSAYTDECQREILRLSLPDNRLAELNSLRESFASLDDLMQGDNQFQRLTIQGSGQGPADEATLQQAWEVAGIAYELLSEPIGLGLTMIYTHNDRILGFDTLNETVQPARIRPSGALKGAAISPDENYLAFSDDEGLRYLDIQSGELTTLLTAPESGYYQPRGWGDSGFVFVTHVPATDGQPLRHGWISFAQPAWHDIPIPEDSSGYGCDTGIDWAPDSNRLAITGLGYGQPCNTNPGLVVVDLSAGTAQQIVAPVINAGGGEDNTITAGARTPAWSPDGQWIAFGLDQDASEALTFPTRLFRSHPDGSNLTPLTNNSQGTAAYPVWAPSGVIFYALNGVSVEQDGIYQYNPTANEHNLVINGADLHPLSVSPDGEFLVYEQGAGLYLWGVVRQSATEVVAPQEGSAPGFVGWMAAGENEE